MQPKKRRILFVGMSDSPHAAKWIRLVADQGWDLHFFPIHLVKSHPLLQGVVLQQPWKKIYPRRWILQQLTRLLGFTPKGWEAHLRTDPMPTSAVFPLPMLSPFDKILRMVRTGALGESEQRSTLVLGPHVLARAIHKLKPDVIHTMEFQHAGYLTLRAKEILGRRWPSKWLATNWGSDIFYFRRFPDHHQQISRLLQNIDFYSCECTRDVGLAQEMGMKAQVMPVLPNTGGFDIEEIAALRSAVPPSKRNILMVKGYQHFAGRSLTALAALELCFEQLKGYKIVMFSVSQLPELRERIAALQQRGFDISILDYSDHSTMLKLFAQARLYLGVSISDAISTSMLEAMAMGAFPIQTNTACCEEWITDGVTGFSIPPDDVPVIAQRIITALTNDALVDGAAGVNWDTVSARLDQRILKEKEIAFYDAIFERIKPGV